MTWFAGKNSVKPKGAVVAKPASGWSLRLMAHWIATTLKAARATALALSLAWLLPAGFTEAQGQAPTGHRQPTASDVPANDSVRGDAGLVDSTPKKRSRSRRQQSNTDVIMKTPNICSNCNE